MSDWIDAIVVAAPPDWEEPAILLAEELGCGQGRRGRDRWSDASGLRCAPPSREVPEDAAVVLVHDAARPLVAEEVIERVLTRSTRAGTASFPAFRSRTRSSASRRPGGRDGGRAKSSSRRRRRRRSSRRCCAGRWRDVATRPTARRSSRPGRPDQGGAGRPAPDQGHGASRPGAGRDGWPRLTRDRRLPHASSSAGRVRSTTRSRASSASSRPPRARGLDEIGFTEHVYYFRADRASLWTLPSHLEHCRYDLDAYVDAVIEAKRRGMPVKLGLEVDYVPGREEERLADCSRPTRGTTSSARSTTSATRASTRSRPGRATSESRRRGVGTTTRLRAASSGLFDSLAHPDLVQMLRPRDSVGLGAVAGSLDGVLPRGLERRAPQAAQQAVSERRVLREARAHGRADHACFRRSCPRVRRPRSRPGGRPCARGGLRDPDGLRPRRRRQEPLG